MNYSHAILIIIYLFSIALTAFIVWFILDRAVIQKKNEELRKAKQEARMAKLAKERFFANMSSRLRNPINTIVGLNQMIIREDNKNVPKEYLVSINAYSDGIKKASDSLGSIVDDLLDMSVIENGKLYLAEREYDTVDFEQFALGKVKENCTEKELILDVDLDEMLPGRLYGDIVKIERITLNLLMNAVKYTDEGSVCFSVSMTERDGDYCTLRISVKDTGIGIKKEDIDKIFNEYTEIENDVDSEIINVGMGLDVCKRLAEFLGGELTCNSVYGEGSEFVFTVKQRIINAAPIGAFLDVGDDMYMEDYMPEFVAPEADILLLDDNRDSINIMTGLLKPTRVFVTTASSLDGCIKLLKGTRYNVVLVDFMVQGINAEEVVEKIKDMNEDIPVYAISPDSLKGEEYYINLGYDGYLSKPVDGKLLERIISKHLPDEIKD